MIADFKLPRLYPKQREAFFNASRYSFTEASTKAGKTFGGIIWLLSRAWMSKVQGSNHWWVAPVYPQAKIAFRRMCRMLRHQDPNQRLWRASETELFIELRGSESKIWFKGSDKTDTLYGEDVYDALLDEASRAKEDAFYAVRSTLTATRGPIRIIGNVKGRLNWAYRMAQKAKAGEPGMSYHKITAADAVAAGVLASEEIDDARRQLPEAVFNELYMAEATEDGSNPFGIDAIRACVVVRASSSKPVAFGVDLAKYQDWCWAIGLDEYGRECVSERWQSDWNSTENRLERLIGDTPAFIDSTGVGDPIVENLQRKCCNVEGFKFSSISKQQLMENLAAGFQKRDIGISDPLLIDELESFEFEYTRTGVKFSAPEGLHDDGVCALAMAYRKLRRFGDVLPFSVNAPKEESKPVEMVFGDVGWN